MTPFVMTVCEKRSRRSIASVQKPICFKISCPSLVHNCCICTTLSKTTTYCGLHGL